jgi:hypothetical protein
MGLVADEPLPLPLGILLRGKRATHFQFGQRDSCR